MMSILDMQRIQKEIAAFDFVRASHLVDALDVIFEGRENYDFEIEYPTPDKPGLLVTWDGVTIFFNCYNPS